MTVQTSHEGLCARCRHVREIVSARGSRFLLCSRSSAEPERFARYPRLPVLRCAGFEEKAPDGGETG